MIALCKKNYIQWDIEKYFKKDKLYHYEKTEHWCRDKNGRQQITTKILYYNKNITVGFTDYEFEKYFYTLQEYRKEKLKKINESRR